MVELNIDPPMTASCSCARPTAGKVVAFLLWVSLANVSSAQNPSLTTAKHLFAAGSYDRAAAVLEHSLKTHENDADEHLLLGQIYALQGRRSQAIEQLSRTIELQPKSAAAYNILGTALNRFAEFSKANEAFATAVVLDPNLAAARIHLAMSLAQAGNATEATNQLAAAIRIDPESAEAAKSHYLLARLYQDSDSHQAIAELQAAVSVMPKYLEAWLALGGLRREAGDQVAALDAFQRAVACDPRDYDAQYELGSELLAQGNTREAIPHLQLARSVAPMPSVGLLYKLDRALRKQGEAEKARAVRLQVQALLAQDTAANQHYQEAQSLAQQGAALDAAGDAIQAAEKYRAALELDPVQDNFRLNYGLALCRLARWKEGIAEFNDILQRDPSNIEARHALYIALDKSKQVTTGPEAIHH